MLKNILIKLLYTFLLLTPFTKNGRAQPAEVVFFGGLSNYLGDLQQKLFTPAHARGVLGLGYKHPISEKFWLRASVSNGKLFAWDGNNSAEFQLRNLEFESNITDGYIAAEYRLFSEEKSSIIPYAFAGVGIFKYNPYVTYGEKNEKVYLQPLGTEGQGLPGYPERQMYKLTQMMVPFGGGILWHATEKWVFGLEMRVNMTFTDYLDDVSKNYALPDVLLNGRGPLAVELAWRRDEIDGRPYPTNEPRRGNPDNDDMFYYLGIHVGWKLAGSGKGMPTGFKKPKNSMGCPKW
jgi:hypothetical protein